MGGAPSRQQKMTFENESPQSVIKVSDDVVQRIRGAEATKEPAVRGHQGPYDPQGSPPFFYEPSLTSIQLRQAHVHSLKENDEYWKKRMHSQQQNHRRMQEIMDEEYLKARGSVEVAEQLANKKQEKDKKKEKPKDTKANIKDIIDCYKNNKDQTMKCAAVVSRFTESVDQQTAGAMHEK